MHVSKQLAEAHYEDLSKKARPPSPAARQPRLGPPQRSRAPLLARCHAVSGPGPETQPFFPGLVDYIISGPVISMARHPAPRHPPTRTQRPPAGTGPQPAAAPVMLQVWQGKDVVKQGRALIGATNPLVSAPGTIRGDFAIDVGRNIIHGSDAVESAQREARPAPRRAPPALAAAGWFVQPGWTLSQAQRARCAADWPLVPGGRHAGQRPFDRPVDLRVKTAGPNAAKKVIELLTFVSLVARSLLRTDDALTTARLFTTARFAYSVPCESGSGARSHTISAVAAHPQALSARTVLPLARLRPPAASLSSSAALSSPPAAGAASQSPPPRRLRPSASLG